MALDATSAEVQPALSLGMGIQGSPSSAFLEAVLIPDPARVFMLAEAE